MKENKEYLKSVKGKKFYLKGLGFNKDIEGSVLGVITKINKTTITACVRIGEKLMNQKFTIGENKGEFFEDKKMFKGWKIESYV